MTIKANRSHPFILAFAFGGVHVALLLLITLFVILSKDPEAGMAYHIFYLIDYPLSRQAGLETIIFGGSILWFCYGLAIQSLWRIHLRKKFIHLAVSLGGILLLFSIPEIRLKSMPDWEEHWERGTEAREVGNIDLAIQHLCNAIESAPPETDILDGIWDYLGRSYEDVMDFDKAENAFIQALNVVKKQTNSHPVDYLNAHNRLSFFYRRTKALDKESFHLKKAIEYNRKVYGNGSIQEADCWHQLAEIVRQRGNSRDAEELLSKAIEMTSNAENTSEWSLNYMKEQLKEWKVEPEGREVRR